MNIWLHLYHSIFICDKKGKIAFITCCLLLFKIILCYIIFIKLWIWLIITFSLSYFIECGAQNNGLKCGYSVYSNCVTSYLMTATSDSFYLRMKMEHILFSKIFDHSPISSIKLSWNCMFGSNLNIEWIFLLLNISP